MGFWRVVGYFISIIMIIGGLLYFPLGLLIAIPGFIFIWMLRRSASQERIEKLVQDIRDNGSYAIQRKQIWKEKQKEHPDNCPSCGKLLLFGTDTNPLCKDCQKLEKDKTEIQKGQDYLN